MYLLLSKSDPNMRALLLATSILCTKESPVRFVFIKAALTPILLNPNQRQTYSGLDSSNSATQSPC